MASSNLLFRYARVSRPAIHDLGVRAKRSAALPDPEEMSAKDRAAWVAGTLAEWGDGEDLALKYSALTGKDPLADRLPSAGDLTEEGIAALRGLDAAELTADRDRALAAAVAARLAGDADAADRAGRLHQFLEHLPALARGTAEARRMAPAVLSRFEGRKRMPPPAERVAEIESQETEAEGEGAVAAPPLAEDIVFLWRLRLRAVKAQTDALMDEDRDRGKAATPAVRKKVASPEGLARTRAAELRARSVERAAKLRELRDMARDTSLSSGAEMTASELVATSPGVSEAEVAAAQTRVKDSPAYTHVRGKSYCEAYAEAVAVTDREEAKPQVVGRSFTCFQDTPQIRFVDEIELMGVAELIKVEETFIRYTEGEISYVENILAGESRLREVRTTKEFETETLEASQEQTETRRESRTTATSNLASETENELRSRFSSDISASASGSGGGSIGVVNFEGSGSMNAGVGIGIDTGTRSETRSELGTEVVEASSEKVIKAAQRSRTSRTRSLFETLNRHEIVNTADTAEHRRGVYMFLDKHVCVTETPYGLRWFLRATVVAPGRNLVCERMTRIAMAMAETDAPPEFNIGPQDIHPSNYLQLAGKFKAQGLAPPPPPTRKLARSYKTDQTSESASGPEGLEKIGRTLMPVFKSYKRHLIADVLPVPEGYRMQEVKVAINHGANGVSLPVDMPMKLASAGLLAMPVIYSYGLLMLPAALWNVLLLVSPILHENTDSSSVTVTVGTEMRESHYYFFEADLLISEILSLFGSFSQMAPALMAQIESWAADLPDDLTTKTTELTTAMTEAISDVVDGVNGVFDAIKTQLESAADPLQLDVAAVVQGIIAALTGFATGVNATLTSLPSDLFGPLSGFVTDVVTLVSDAAEDAMSDLMAALLASSENNQDRSFSESFGATGEVPVTLNAVTIKPGITVTLVACLARTEESLNQWRLECFSALYQAHQQQVAAYESARALSTGPTGTKSPGTLREEERRALREIVLHLLNRVQDAPDPDTVYTFDRLNLFEHAIDWPNMSWRLYNYGPSLEEIAMERRGVFEGADARRRAFLTAPWAQVMLPLSDKSALEQAMLAYFESGATEIGAELGNDELTALWADVISRRSELAEAPEPVSKREIVLPTDLIVLSPDGSLPENPDTACGS